MLLPHNKVSGGVQDSQIMIPSFFDRFYVMPPLTNGVHYIFPFPQNKIPIWQTELTYTEFRQRINFENKKQSPWKK